jgi:hypothetical protein
VFRRDVSAAMGPVERDELLALAERIGNDQHCDEQRLSRLSERETEVLAV